MQSVSPAYLKTNLLSGLTVALALVPEAIAFALVAHVSPLTGLYAAVLVSFITSAFGGRPGMISGAAGALAVVMVALVVEHGVQYLFAAIVLMGLLQMLFAAARLGKFIRMVPYPVMLGFVNGLALVIFIAQFGHFKIGGAMDAGRAAVHDAGPGSRDDGRHLPHAAHHEGGAGDAGRHPGRDAAAPRCSASNRKPSATWARSAAACRSSRCPTCRSISRP